MSYDMREKLSELFINTLLVIPVIGLLSLAHEIVGYEYLAVEWIQNQFGLTVTNTVLSSEHVFIAIPYLLWGIGVSTTSYNKIYVNQTSAQLSRGIQPGFLFGLPLIVASALLTETWGMRIASVLLLLVLFLSWGGIFILTHNWLIASEKNRRSEERTAFFNRREFLILVGFAGISTFLSTRLSLRYYRERRIELGTTMQVPPEFPPHFTARTYSTRGAFSFPEQQNTRYQPHQHPFGVCFSGGGLRAASAALGQIRGLHELGILDVTGAISCVSGGSWVSIPFTYAPEKIDYLTLFGAVREPENLTPQNLTQIDPQTLAAPITTMTNDNILRSARDIMRSISFSETGAFDRFYSRLLGEYLLNPYDLGDPHTMFTLDEIALHDILARNPALQKKDFYLAHPNRPFLICGSTQIFPVGENAILRPFEFTSLYSGMSTLYPNAGHQRSDLGGGYIENFAFDSEAPLDSQTPGLITVPTPEPLFLLSDILGSTSSTPGAGLVNYHVPNRFPEFKLVSPEKSTSPVAAYPYTVIDGSIIENIGIVPLLKRQYPVILAFVNGATPLGTQAANTIQGIEVQISRLFGMLPDAFAGDPDAQIFPSEQFDALAQGLVASRQNGQGAMYVDTYKIVQPNPFDIPAYPNDNKATVIWFFNDLNENWVNKLSSDVRSLLNSTDPTNRMDNFPHYNTVNQNRTENNIPQPFYTSPEQINLLAHMWAYTVIHEAGNLLFKLRDQHIGG